MKKSILIVTAFLLSGVVHAQELSVLPVQGNVHLISGAGVINKLSEKPLQYVINTHYDPEFTGGNIGIRRAGVTITGANVTGDLSDARDGAQIIAHDNVLNRMSAPTGKQAATEVAAWPTQTFIKGKKDLYFNDEPIEIIHQPNATTDGDSIVFFRHSDVIVTGDILNMNTYPWIDPDKGGTVQGTINALNKILEIAVPKHEEEGGTYIIPGHCRICDEFDALEYRDMVVIVRDRVQAAVKKGMSLDQVKRAGYTKDYDARFDAKTGLGSADKFIEAVYKTVSGGKK